MQEKFHSGSLDLVFRNSMAIKNVAAVSNRHALCDQVLSLALAVDRHRPIIWVMEFP
jgi:hypothetical protein